MNIIEATKEAMETEKGIINRECKQDNIYILPSNTNECCFIIPIGLKFPETAKYVSPRWNPTAYDILREDWELYPQ